MFKTFFTKIGTWMSKTAKAYIKARGIARSIIDAIEAAILGTAIGSFIINKIKLWRARRKLKKQLHNRGAENYTRDPDGLGMYDENGYRMTNTEIEKKNKELMDSLKATGKYGITDSMKEESGEELKELADDYKDRIEYLPVNAAIDKFSEQLKSQIR